MSRDVNLPRMMSQVGLEGFETISQEQLAQDIMPAAITGLADGDLITVHPPYEGTKAELYGEDHYGQGQVAQTIGHAAIENGMTPGDLYNFQSFAAEYFTAPDNSFGRLTERSAVKIHSQALVIDNNLIILAKAPSRIIDYGACLTSRNYIKDQMAFIDQNKPPFSYVPITRLPFINQVLIRTYDVSYGEGMRDIVANRQLYMGREDGVASATDEIIRAQVEHNAPAGISDIVLCVGTEHMTREDLKPGIKNAHKILKEGGMLVVRSLTHPTPDEIGTEEIVSWASDEGFAVRGAFTADLDDPTLIIKGGHFGKGEIQTVILTK